MCSEKINNPAGCPTANKLNGLEVLGGYKDEAAKISPHKSCNDQTCTKCGGKRLFQWRTSSIAKRMPLPKKGMTYLHIKINNAPSMGKFITGAELVPSGQDRDFYEGLAQLMYNKAKSIHHF